MLISHVVGVHIRDIKKREKEILRGISYSIVHFSRLGLNMIVKLKIAGTSSVRNCDIDLNVF